jgi:hypothetical protein
LQLDRALVRIGEIWFAIGLLLWIIMPIKAGPRSSDSGDL